MAVAGVTERPTDRDMVRVAEDCAVDVRRSHDIIRQVHAAVKQWPRFAHAFGVSAATTRRIGDVIAGLASDDLARP